MTLSKTWGTHHSVARGLFAEEAAWCGGIQFDTPPRAPIALQTEVVIRIRSECGGRRGVTAGEQLRLELQRLRAEGYEIDLYIRGTWRRSGGYQRAKEMPETFLGHWRLCDTELITLGTGQLNPCPKRKPHPEIVLRGVRRGA